MGPEKWLILLVLACSCLSYPAQTAALTGSVDVFSPANGSWTNGTNDTMEFTFAYADPHNATAVCYLFVNEPVPPVGSVSAENDTTAIIYSGEDFDEGENTWWVTCVNITSISSEEMTFFSDRTPPSVELTSPTNRTIAEAGDIEFSFIFSDRFSSDAYCTLYVDGSQTGGNVDNDTEASRSLTLDPGIYGWHVECTDNTGNTGYSGAFVLDLRLLTGLSITAPDNITYSYADDIPLRFMVSGTADWMGYSLDGAANVTVSGNTTFDVQAEGPHVIEVYANSSSGDLEHDAVHFTVSMPKGIRFLSPDRDSYSLSTVPVSLSVGTDAVWCGLSLDGGQNVSMGNETPRSWSYELTNLSEGPHDIRAWCNDSGGAWMTNGTGFDVLLTQFTILVESPSNKTYWNTTGLDVVITATRDADTCDFYLDSEGPMMMYESSPRRWYYNITLINAGTFELTVVCNESGGLSNSSSLEFTVRSDECESNETGICTATQQCVNGMCAEIECSGCRYAYNRTCLPYECCSDQDCLQGQQCIDHDCSGVECECGEIQGHTCVRYECCSNFDCGENERCDTESHECVGKAMIVLAPQSVVAGEVFEVTVMGQDGTPIQGASVKIVYGSGTEKELVTDGQGMVSVIATETGTVQIKASAPGYDERTVSLESVPGFNWWIVAALMIILLGAGGGYFYWQQLPPLGLVKLVSGHSVTLKVKNGTIDNLENVLIVDSVPAGAFISCNLEPRLENFGDEDHLTWFASLAPGEEIVINYEATQATDSFLVRIGDEEYRSGYGIISIVRDILERLFPKPKKSEMPITGE